MKKPWPTKREESADAVQAFSDALTKAGSDQTFRDLIKSPEKAREAVSDLGQIEIPDDVVVIFHEPEDCQNIYPFYLPETNEPLLAYHKYFQGCKPKFQLEGLTLADFLAREMKVANLGLGVGPKKSWAEPAIAEAFTAVLRRSQTDPEFRKKLIATVPLTSAKEAVSAEGNIEVPPEVVILFHEHEANEKYHMFRLPPFNPNAKADYKYRAHFEGFYFVW